MLSSSLKLCVLSDKLTRSLEVRTQRSPKLAKVKVLEASTSGDCGLIIPTIIHYATTVGAARQANLTRSSQNRRGCIYPAARFSRPSRITFMPTR
ncbi:hypothetical protein KQX54_017304 [Cotesia glomerata]|uniref:Uncharacterized protein n=1 Tax=Cotesia glomerata TaxID=32391 RepID=A0AAV7IEB9_COTGL|nr:hypothetical protein KQX54_017304 [Cotesia glomerata]